LNFSWLDVIDPHPKQDKKWVIGFFEWKYPDHRDYSVDVRWNSGPVQVTVCKAKVINTQGYPFTDK
jgi:hypothetical protein